MTKEKEKRIIIVVKEDLHKEVKKRALERGLTIKQYMLNCLAAWIEHEKKYE